MSVFVHESLSQQCFPDVSTSDFIYFIYGFQFSSTSKPSFLCHTFEEKVIHVDRHVHLFARPSVRHENITLAIILQFLYFFIELLNYSAYDDTDIPMPNAYSHALPFYFCYSGKSSAVDTTAQHLVQNIYAMCIQQRAFVDIYGVDLSKNNKTVQKYNKISITFTNNSSHFPRES